MIAVVTGSSGFIGSHLVDALLERGATVRSLVRPGTALESPDARVARHEADLLDRRSVRESPVWEGATHVFHLAGATRARTLAQFRAGNVLPTVNVLSALAGCEAPRPRMVFVSSQAAAGPAKSADRPVRETDRPSPVEAYGRSKLEAEHEVLRHQDLLPVTIVRPSAVYGPRDRDFLHAFRQASRRLAFHAVPVHHAFSVVHVGDLARALILSAEHAAAAGRTYFVANEAPMTWRGLYRDIALASGTRPIELQLPPSTVRLAALAGDLVAAVTGRTLLLNRNKAVLARQRWWLCDARSAREELGWRSEVAPDRGIRETYRWYVDAGWLR
jgi:nucleoside-diphosphate-sugar epimerase